ncbi:hypothetical protein TNCV_4626981 [Trichonephila clavipes]|nr:hypothetical protein TNCV_4626981 [Trichonephila clavipes]
MRLHSATNKLPASVRVLKLSLIPVSFVTWARFGNLKYFLNLNITVLASTPFSMPPGTMAPSAPQATPLKDSGNHQKIQLVDKHPIRTSHNNGHS